MTNRNSGKNVTFSLVARDPDNRLHDLLFVPDFFGQGNVVLGLHGAIVGCDVGLAFFVSYF